MTHSLRLVAILSGLALGPLTARAAPQFSNQASNGDYLYDGATLQFIQEDPGRTRYTQWQVWFYPREERSAEIPAYARWGSVQGSSAGAVTKHLRLWQNFEHAYMNFFGPAAWGQFTFSHPVGPIAVMTGAESSELNALVAGADDLNRRISLVIAAVLPSLENNRSSGPSSPAPVYFAQVRDSLQGVVKFYDQVARLPDQLAFLKLQLARLRAEIQRAEEAAPKITSILPTVKLPAASDWMRQTEYEGSDGSVETTIAEIGAAAWIRQVWSGGDGKMTGTETVTVVPYQDIKSVRVIDPVRGNQSKWTLSIEPAGHSGFPRSVTSPARTTPKRSYSAVDLVDSELFLFLDFSSAGDAQDAYAFFLYHKQLGR